MRRVTVVAVVLGALLSAAAAPAVHAESLKAGLLCGFVSVADPIAKPGALVADLYGGPVAIVDGTDPAVVHTGHLTCTIQVGSNGTHADPDAVSASGMDTSLVVGLHPVAVTFVKESADQAVWLCTSVTTDEGTWYFDVAAPYTSDDGHWSTSTAASCRAYPSDY